MNLLIIYSIFFPGQVQGKPEHLSATDNRTQQLVCVCGRLEKRSLQLGQPSTRGHAVEGLCSCFWIHTSVKRSLYMFQLHGYRTDRSKVQYVLKHSPATLSKMRVDLTDRYIVFQRLNTMN